MDTHQKIDEHDVVDNFPPPVLELGDQPSKEFLEVFSKLGSAINGEIIEKAWKHYDTIGQQIVLEGNRTAWMACAFFSSVWQATPIGQELICKYSLSKLLDICGISILEFFDKLDSWTELNISSRRLVDYVKRVQANLAVAVIVFKKLIALFRHVFMEVAPPLKTRDSPQKAKYYNPLLKLASSDIFGFTWIMFIALRKQFKPSQEDLLHSFHLLICLIDYIVNVLQEAGLQKHLNISFVRSLSEKGQTPLEAICEEFDGVVLDAKHLNTHWLLPRLKSLALDGLISGHGTGNGGILEKMEENRNAFERMYEENLMIRSEVDERLFLEPALLNNSSHLFTGEFDEIAASVLQKFGTSNEQMVNIDMMIKMVTQNCYEKLGKNDAIKTPLAGKAYVITPETMCPNTVLPSDHNELQRIKGLLAEFKGIEDELLVYLFEDCQENPKEFVAEQVQLCSQRFVTQINLEITKNSDFDSEFQFEIAAKINEIELLFYYLLRKIVTHDRERAVSLGMEMQLDLGVIFLNTEFLVSVYICASELILFAHNSERHFPWAAKLFEDVVASIDFYKIFELVVRAGVGLGREAVKHLNKVEETVLDELAWLSDSPLWTLLTANRSAESFGEIQIVPSSQLLSRSSTAYAQNLDLPYSTIIFFKKVYHLAAIRISDLTERLRIGDDLTRHKIWTLFEYVFREQTHLLRDRHLDQILMCVVYIVGKVCSLDITFQNIMFHYRHQPQSSSRIYRKVLMNNDKIDESQQKEFADLINFYNRVFVKYVEDFVKKLHPTGSESKENIVPLISLPKLPLNPLTPIKLVTDRINVVPMSQYTHSIGATSTAQPNLGRFSRGRYNFHQSPSKDLRNINSMMARPLPPHSLF